MTEEFYTEATKVYKLVDALYPKLEKRTDDPKEIESLIEELDDAQMQILKVMLIHNKQKTSYLRKELRKLKTHKKNKSI